MIKVNVNKERTRLTFFRYRKTLTAVAARRQQHRVGAGKTNVKNLITQRALFFPNQKSPAGEFSSRANGTGNLYAIDYILNGLRVNKISK